MSTIDVHRYQVSTIDNRHTHKHTHSNGTASACKHYIKSRGVTILSHLRKQTEKILLDSALHALLKLKIQGNLINLNTCDCVSRYNQ